MAAFGIRRLGQRRGFAERRCPDIRTLGLGRGTFVGQSTEHRFDIVGIELIELLDVLDDARKLRGIYRDLLVAYFQVGKRRYFSYIHNLPAAASETGRRGV